MDTTDNIVKFSQAVENFADPAPSPLAKRLGKKRVKNTAVSSGAADPYAELRRLVGFHRRNARTIQSWLSPIADRTFTKNGQKIVVKCAMSPLVIEDAKRAVEALKANQQDLVKAMIVELKKVPIYVEFLGKVYGVGGVTAAYLVAMVDIRRCPNVSNLIRYCGNAPDHKTGRREARQAAPKFAPDGSFNAETFGTFNDALRRNNWQIMSSMLKNASKALAKAPNGSTSKYLDRWNAALHSHNTMHPESKVSGFHKGRMKATDLFLWDLYVMWRTIEGLDIRPDKYSAVRGRWHGGGECVDQRYTLTLDEAREIVGDVGGRPSGEKLVFAKAPVREAGHFLLGGGNT